MSFNPFAFDPSIDSRLNAAAFSSISQGAWNTTAPPTIKASSGSLPYIIYEIVDGSFEDMTFEQNIAGTVYRVYVYDHRKNGIVPSHTVIKNIFGNSEGTDNTPTVGLARWEITGVEDTADARLRPVDFGTQHSDDVYCYWMDFAIEVKEA